MPKANCSQPRLALTRKTPSCEANKRSIIRGIPNTWSTNECVELVWIPLFSCRFQNLSRNPTSVFLLLHWLHEGSRTSNSKTTNRTNASTPRQRQATAHQRAGQRVLALPVDARSQPSQLASVERRNFGAGQKRRQANLPIDRLFQLPLVPRDGARVVFRQRDRQVFERAFHLHQSRPRRTPRRGRNLHAGAVGGQQTRRWLAAVDVLDA